MAHSPVNRRDLPEAGYRVVASGMIVHITALLGDRIVTPRIVDHFRHPGRIIALAVCLDRCIYGPAGRMREYGRAARSGSRHWGLAAAVWSRRDPRVTSERTNEPSMMIIS